MPSKKGSGSGLPVRSGNSRNGGYRASVIALLVISVVAPLLILTGRTSNSFTAGNSYLAEDASDATHRRSALEHLESLLPKEVLDIITVRPEKSGPLNLNFVGRKDLSSSWVREDTTDVSQKASNSYQEPKEVLEVRNPAQDSAKSHPESKDADTDHADWEGQEGGKKGSEAENAKTREPQTGGNQEVAGHVGGDHVGTPGILISDGVDSQQGTLSKDGEPARIEMKEGEEVKNLEAEATKKPKDADGALVGKYSAGIDTENQDSLVRLMRDQLIMARAYANIAQAQSHFDLVSELKLLMKEHQKVVDDANVDAELPSGASLYRASVLLRSHMLCYLFKAVASDKMNAMGQLLVKAQDRHYDAATMVKKLRAMLQQAEEHTRMLKKQNTFLSQLAAKTVPKGLHCLSMRLTVEYHLLPLDQRDFAHGDKLEDPSLYHYALFSDNILAAAVVVNSTIVNAKEPEKHVFHVVTDKLNYGAMKMWFLANPPGAATIQVENVDDFKWLNSSYCPVLRQLESVAMKEYYFKADHTTTLAAGTSTLKYRNPKYLSMLNHLRFYLPEVFPKLDKILFLDDDIVVQKDLTPLWDIDLHGNVNGAVETCGASFHRFDKYLNFSNPLIAKNFDPNACGWAYGMNVFDLKEWKKQDITGIYHRWQSMNEDRVLWKLGTLPPGLITFNNLTYSLEKSWHVLGLGYNPSVEDSEINKAAVIHYNGNMKPWLEIGMTKFKPFWSKFVKYGHPYLQQCNISD